MDEDFLHVAHARGIVLVPVGRCSRDVALRVYEAHVDTEVFPLLVTPGSPFVGVVPAINVESLSKFPDGTFPGRPQFEAGVKHIHSVPSGRLLVVIEFAHLISAYDFNDVVNRVRKAAGSYFTSRTRMIVLFDERNPIQGQFYEAACFNRDWFTSRALLVSPADPADPGAVESADEVMAELRRRVGDGVWPSDPWPAGMFASINRRRVDDPADVVGGRVVVAATGRGLKAAINGLAAAFAGDNAEKLRLGFSLATASGAERFVVDEIPFSLASRDTPGFFSTILATVSWSTTIYTVGKRPKQAVVPRGTLLWWEGKLSPVEVIDADTVDSTTGVHYTADEVVNKPESVEHWLVCWMPGAFFGDSTGPVEVKVPVFYGDPAQTRVRAAGLSTKPARELDLGESAVMGYTVGFNSLEPNVPARVPTRLLTVAAEGFDEDQVGVVLDMCTGPVSELTTAPVEGSRFFLNLAAPYGTGLARRGPTLSLSAVRERVPRTRTMRVGKEG